MKLSDWLYFSVVIWSIVGIGLFNRSVAFESADRQHKAAPNLSDDKIKLADACVDELRQVNGISLRVAREIHDFVALNPAAKFEDLDEIKGVGPKTIEKLKAHFE
jgi:DNA uptake protein ComE-like DNA-binding protein